MADLNARLENPKYSVPELKEAKELFYRMLDDIRVMLAHARDQGIQLDDKLRNELTLLYSGVTEAEQQSSVRSGESSVRSGAP